MMKYTTKEYFDATCFSVGYSGNCGCSCPVLLRGDCELEGEIAADCIADNPQFKLDTHEPEGEL